MQGEGAGNAKSWQKVSSEFMNPAQVRVRSQKHSLFVISHVSIYEIALQVPPVFHLSWIVKYETFFDFLLSLLLLLLLLLFEKQ
jgi:hypothetical protein